MQAREFYQSVAERAGLSREEATDLTRATLRALAERLSQGMVRALARGLPDGVAEEVRDVRGRPSRHTGLDEVELQVSEHTGLRLDEVHAGIAAVLAEMCEALPAELVEKVLAQLPDEFRGLTSQQRD